MRYLLSFVGLTLVFIAIPACAQCSASYLASGSTQARDFDGQWQTVSYSAVRVDWDTGAIDLRRSSDGLWIPLGPTPSSPDSNAMRNVVSELVHREVDNAC